MKAGVLAMQGAFHKHVQVMESLGIHTHEVRTPDDLTRSDGLIIPGGESTVIVKLLVKNMLMEKLEERIHEGMPVFGTCAGMILLAKSIDSMDQPTLGVMDITVERNAYGRQKESFEAEFPVNGLDGGTFHGIFIRAPKITGTGKGVDILAEYESVPILVRQKNLLASSFHPELTGDTRIHKLFSSMMHR